MPRIGIMSDIHGNLEALEAVLRAVQAEGIKYLVHLGDLVGYNASPRECVELLNCHQTISILGNHDLAIMEPKAAENFNVLAYQALKYSLQQLRSQHIRYLQSLPRIEVIWDRYLLCHGSPENLETYILNVFQARRIFNLLGNGYRGIRICFFGHTHLQALWSCDPRGKVSTMPALSGSMVLDRDLRYLVNPGSVGQPRQGDNQAHYLVFDSEEEVVHFRAVPYDIGKAQDKILRAQLPEYLALRLREGI